MLLTENGLLHHYLLISVLGVDGFVALVAIFNNWSTRSQLVATFTSTFTSDHVDSHYARTEETMKKLLYPKDS